MAMEFEIHAQSYDTKTNGVLSIRIYQYCCGPKSHSLLTMKALLTFPRFFMKFRQQWDNQCCVHSCAHL